MFLEYEVIVKYILFLLISSSILFAQQNKVPKILFSSNRDTTATQPSLYIMNPDGTDIERFIDSLIGFQPRISKDGEKITYTGVFNDSILGPPQIHVMNIDGSDDHVVSLCNVQGNWEPCVAYHYNPAFSPDGNFVAYYDEDGWTDSDIYVVSIHTNNFFKKILTKPITDEAFYDWSSTEDRLLFISYFFNDTIDYDGELCSMDSNGENWTRLTYDSFIILAARYSPNGEKIAYVSNNQENKWEIYLMDKDGGNKIQLTNNEIDEGISGLSWLPNGQALLFEADDQIFLIDISTRDITQITNDDHSNHYPEWIEIDLTNVNEKNIKPIIFSLFNVYPNPFNSTTNIEYSISESKLVIIKVFDILGREIAELVNEQKSAGTYSVSFDAMNLASGIYFYSISAGKFNQVNKMILLR